MSGRIVYLPPEARNVPVLMKELGIDRAIIMKTTGLKEEDIDIFAWE